MFLVYFSKRKFPSSLRLYDVLNGIPGVGQELILGLFRKLGISIHTRIQELKPPELRKATALVEDLCTFEDLTRIRIQVMKYHLRYGSYRGIRIRQGLPFNGQRTRSNAANARKRLFLGNVSFK